MCRYVTLYTDLASTLIFLMGTSNSGLATRKFWSEEGRWAFFSEMASSFLVNAGMSSCAGMQKGGRGAMVRAWWEQVRLRYLSRLSSQPGMPEIGWSPLPHTVCFENYLNQKAEGVLDIDDALKRTVDSMSAIPGSKVKITGVYEF